MSVAKVILLTIIITFLMGVFTSIFIFSVTGYWRRVDRGNEKYYPQITWENEWKKD
ncbi:MAG TPA: hypothetical protein VJC03_04770 [bacterium]|nr:hypothetical protein [bacterium]